MEMGNLNKSHGEMFKDSYEDGVTGNEEPYDNSDLQEPARTRTTLEPTSTSQEL